MSCQSRITNNISFENGIHTEFRRQIRDYFLDNNYSLEECIIHFVYQEKNLMIKDFVINQCIKHQDEIKYLYDEIQIYKRQKKLETLEI